jgi:hypothetical protein
MDAYTRLKRIKKVSSLFRGFCIFFLVIYVIAIIISIYAIWSGSSILHINVNVNGMGLQQLRDLSAGGKTFITLTILLASVLILKGFYHLQKLFFYYSKGEIFTTEANGQIRNFGVTVCLWPFCQLLCILLSDIAVYLTYEIPIRMTNTPPDKSVSVLTLLILGAAIIYISWVMEMGRELREDQELTI